MCICYITYAIHAYTHLQIYVYSYCAACIFGARAPQARGNIEISSYICMDCGFPSGIIR